jgi:hypothetical protein
MAINSACVADGSSAIRNAGVDYGWFVLADEPLERL